MDLLDVAWRAAPAGQFGAALSGVPGLLSATAAGLEGSVAAWWLAVFVAVTRRLPCPVFLGVKRGGFLLLCDLGIYSLSRLTVVSLGRLPANIRKDVFDQHCRLLYSLPQ
jgi:hypothetical protein